MTKLIRVVFASAAILAFFVMLTANAMAADEWLANGAPIATELAAQTSVEMLLETTGIFLEHVDVLCSWIYDGTVGPGSKDLVTDFLTLSGELLELLYGPESLLVLPMAVECVVEEGGMCKENLLWLGTINLPWETEIELMEGSVFLDKTLNAGGNPGFLIVCQSALSGMWEEEECTGNTSDTLKNLSEGGVEGTLAETFGSETGKCITPATLETLWLEAGVALTTLTAGGFLAVS